MSNVLGISERLLTTNSYEKSNSERKLYIHLFNTYTSERSLDYKKYYTSTTSRKFEVKRVLHFSERQIDYKRYYKEHSDIELFTTSYYKQLSERQLDYKRYFIETDERNFTINYVLHLETDRKFLYEGKFVSYRNFFVDSWIINERQLITHSRDKIIIADGRLFFVQDYSHLTSIRQFITPITSIVFKLKVNPTYNNLNNKIFKVNLDENIKANPFVGSVNDGKLKVVDEVIEFINLPIKDNLNDVSGELNFYIYNKEKNNYDWFVISDLPIINLYLDKYNLTSEDKDYYTTNSLIVSTKSNLLFRFGVVKPIFVVNNIDGNINVGEILKDLENSKQYYDYINYLSDKLGLFGIKIIDDKSDIELNKLYTLNNIEYKPIKLNLFISEKLFTELENYILTNYINNYKEPKINVLGITMDFNYTFLNELENYQSKELTLKKFIFNFLK
jgi:hypothetical protein